MKTTLVFPGNAVYLIPQATPLSNHILSLHLTHKFIMTSWSHWLITTFTSEASCGYCRCHLNFDVTKASLLGGEGVGRDIERAKAQSCNFSQVSQCVSLIFCSHCCGRAFTMNSKLSIFAIFTFVPWKRKINVFTHA